jgi:hypothetical protein
VISFRTIQDLLQETSMTFRPPNTACIPLDCNCLYLPPVLLNNIGFFVSDFCVLNAYASTWHWAVFTKHKMNIILSSHQLVSAYLPPTTSDASLLGFLFYLQTLLPLDLRGIKDDGVMKERSDIVTAVSKKPVHHPGEVVQGQLKILG